MKARDSDTLRHAGEALFGPLWQSELARELGIALRTLQRWAAGSYPIPAGIWLEIAALARARGDKLLALALELESARP
jgi:hypothetical protein